MIKQEVAEKLAKIYEFLLGRVDYPNAQDALTKGSFIAGGSIVSLTLDESISDYDIWFRNIESYNAVVEYFDKRGVKPKRVSRFASTYVLYGSEFQFIKNRLGEPMKTISGFDFVHTQNYYLPDGTIFIKNEDAIRKKEIIFTRGNLEHPVNTFQRVLKFVRRGWFIKQSSMIDLMLDLKEVDTERLEKDYAGSR